MTRVKKTFIEEEKGIWLLRSEKGRGQKTSKASLFQNILKFSLLREPVASNEKLHFSRFLQVIETSSEL